MKLLIVDDNKQNLHLLQVLLRGHGHEVISAINGADALDKARRDPPDMIIADILMPVMDGFTLCREWKRDERLKKIPFVFYTATYVNSGDENLALSLGADRYIVKPVAPDEFMGIIQDVIMDKGAGRIIAAEPAPGEESEVYKLYNGRLVKKLEKKMIDVQREIGERRRAEETLRDSERKLEIRNRIAHIFLTEPDEEIYGDVLQVILSAAKSRYGVFGYIDENGDLVCPSMTRDIWDECRVPDKDMVFPRDAWGGIWARAMVEKETFYSNKPFKVPEGHIAVTRALSVPVIHRGKAIGLVLVGNKETDYDEKNKRFLESIVNYIAPVLDAKIKRDKAEKETRRLQDQLRQARKMEAIGALAGGIAHDFNNILAALMGSAELARMKVPEDSAAIPNLEQILKASTRAKDLVQQILTISRKQNLDPKPLHLKNIAEEALKLLRATLPTTIEIREEFSRNMGIIHADPTQMHQVMVNLCTNAAHAMGEEGGVLEIGIRNMEVGSDEPAFKHLNVPPGPYLRLTVSDTGTGMAPDLVDKAFEPYFTTKEKGVGTGMGLSVVQGIVKSHGGAITVYSEPGKGSAFHVYLPLIHENVKEETVSDEPLPTGNEHILFVDDERDIVETGRELLEQLGYKVTSMTDSLKALALFRRRPEAFDLVITDMTMPRMTGDKLAIEIMKIRPHTPVILCTGFSEKISGMKAKEMGIGAFAMKPLVMRELAGMVRGVLDG